MQDGHRASAADGRRDRIASFAADLRELRAQAGNPSFRKMAGRSGHISHTTLHEAAAGSRFPSWETTREFVTACGHEPARWRGRWDAVKAALARDDTTTAEPTTAAPERSAAPRSVSDRSAPEQRAPEAPVTGAASVEPESTEQRTATDQHTSDSFELAAEHARRPRPWQWLWVAASVVVLLTVTGAIISMKQRGAPDWAASVLGGDDTRPLHPGDRSIFIDDVTIPDKSPIGAGERFLKVWEIQNVGSVLWHNRFLERMDPPVGEQDCQTPHRIKIGDTLPNERVKVGVLVTAPARPGTICFARWKMVDERGRELLPSSRPVYFEVRIVP